VWPELFRSIQELSPQRFKRVLDDTRHAGKSKEDLFVGWSNLSTEDFRCLSESFHKHIRKETTNQSFRRLWTCFRPCLCNKIVVEEVPQSSMNGNEENSGIAADKDRVSHDRHPQMMNEKSRCSLKKTVHHPLDNGSTYRGNDEVDSPAASV
jgi:hypothetical protein